MLLSDKARGHTALERHHHKLARAAKRRRSGGNPKAIYAFKAWDEIAERMKTSDPRVVLLDFDGTLAPLRKDPTATKLSQRAKRLLRRLAATKGVTVAIVSGRSARTVRDLVGLDQIGYFGLHGSENIKNSPDISLEERRALQSAKRWARRGLRDFQGVGFEDKGLGFTIHYRGAGNAAVRGASQALLAAMAPLRHALNIHNGKKIWEVLPRQIAGKGFAVQKMVAQFPTTAGVLYIGDDEPDEKAFAALDEHITIRVGKSEATHARFYLRNPTEVLQFLSKLGRELQ